MAAGRSKSLTTGNVRCGVAAVHEVPGSLALETPVKLYNMCMLPVFLYGSECWAISEIDARRINALDDHWCLHMLLGIRWYQFVWNDDVQRLTKQPKLTAIIQSGRLTLFGHIMRMDRCQEDPVIPPSSGMEKTTMSSPHQHHMA